LGSNGEKKNIEKGRMAARVQLYFFSSAEWIGKRKLRKNKPDPTYLGIYFIILNICAQNSAQIGHV
jgi:hypothetical protein